MDDGTDDGANPMVRHSAPDPDQARHVAPTDAWSSGSWSGQPEVGRHRERPHDTRPPSRRRLAIGVGVAGVVLAIVAPLTAMSPDDEVTGTDYRASTISVVDVSDEISSAPAPTPTPSALSPTPSPSPTATRTTTAARFTPVTYQAEASGNALSGSAWVYDYPGASGGQIVRNLGDWGDSGHGRGHDGSLRFDNVSAPSTGTYVLTFWYVHLDGESPRTVVITVTGSAPITVTVSAGSRCCASKSVRVSLRKGANSITFANPRDHAPSIDKIVISKP